MRPVQDTKRSHSKKTSTLPTRRTVPLPLEIIFRPDVRGTYDTGKAVTVEDDEEFCRFEFEPGQGSTRLVSDPWIMRGEFLEDEDRGGSLIGMTLAYGRFGVGRDDLVVPTENLGKRFQPREAFKLLMHEFGEWQMLVRAAMTTEMSKWPALKVRFSLHKVDRLCQPMALSVEWHHGRPVGIIRCSGVLEALIATLQMDALIGAEYRFCSCVGCPRSFKVKRRDQRYCDDDCKHRQVVRDGRERERKALLQSKSRHSERKSK